MTFSENIYPGSGEIQIFEIDGTLIETLKVSSSMISGTTVSLNTIADLKPNVSYYVLISPTALKNSAGINFEGIQNKNIFQFKKFRKIEKKI